MAKVLMLFSCLAMLAGCASYVPAGYGPGFPSPEELHRMAYSAGTVNTPFMRYMDQRDAERRVAREIADELERRSIQP